MCVQTSMVWQQIYAEDRVATFAEPWEYYSKKHNLNILKVRWEYSWVTDLWVMVRDAQADDTDEQ